MNSKKILLLGGYGNTGRAIAKHLATEEGIELIIAGRNLKKANQLVSLLKNEYPELQIFAQKVDVSIPDDLSRAMKGCQLVVVASSTSNYTETVVRLAIEQSVDYVDTHIDMPSKWEAFEKLEQEIHESGCLFITGCGFHPGLPPVLIRYAAKYLDTLEIANVASIFRLNWGQLNFSSTTREELIEEFRDYDPSVYTNGKWRKQSFSKPVYFDFNNPFGRQPCTPMCLREMKPLQEIIPGLQETGFYIAGFNPTTDKYVIPFVYLVLKVSGSLLSKPMARILEWSLKKHTKPPFGTILLLQASGIKKGGKATIQVRLAHSDAYEMTAIPVVACIRQYLKNNLPLQGLWHQGMVLDPDTALEDFKNMGIEVTIEQK